MASRVLLQPRTLAYSSLLHPFLTLGFCSLHLHFFSSPCCSGAPCSFLFPTELFHCVPLFFYSPCCFIPLVPLSRCAVQSRSSSFFSGLFWFSRFSFLPRCSGRFIFLPPRLRLSFCVASSCSLIFLNRGGSVIRYFPVQHKTPKAPTWKLRGNVRPGRFTYIRLSA